MRALALILLAAATLPAQMKTALIPSQSPLVTIRVVFTAGTASDPADKPGLANLTASMLSDGGSKELTYKQIQERMYPMAASVGSQVDKEMTVFSGATHVDNLEAYYKLFRGMILEPGWREDDFKRIKEDAINQLRVNLRGNNDEELGKEVLYETLYAGHPYGHENTGAVSGLEKITLDDLKKFYREHYAVSNLILGLAGGYSKSFESRMAADLQKLLPAKAAAAPKLPQPKPIGHTRALIVEKDTRSVAYSIGFPIAVKRGDPDFAALLVAQSCFGQHRLSGRRLYARMREERGLNYGDYAYIEYFPQGMFRFEPAPNLARQQQIFQVWIRPVEPVTAAFALRLGMYELDRLVRDGLTQKEFDMTRNFLGKYVNLLTKTKSAELGYKIDSEYYRIPTYNAYLKAALAKLTLADVNRAIKKHLRADRVQIVAVAKDAAGLQKQLLSNDPTPMIYNSPKKPEIMEEDKAVEKFPLGLRAGDVTIVKVEKVFE